MKLSEAIREWKRNITTHMAVEYVLTLRADINAFSDAAHSLERENAKLRDLVDFMLSCQMDKGNCDKCRWLNDLCEVEVLARELGIEV